MVKALGAQLVTNQSIVQSPARHIMWVRECHRENGPHTAWLLSVVVVVVVLVMMVVASIAVVVGVIFACLIGCLFDWLIACLVLGLSYLLDLLN